MTGIISDGLRSLPSAPSTEKKHFFSFFFGRTDLSLLNQKVVKKNKKCLFFDLT